MVIGGELQAAKTDGTAWSEADTDRVVAIGNEGTNRMSRGKSWCKSPFLAHQLLVFFAPTRYRVVKITCSCSMVVLRTTKHTMVYFGSDPSLVVIALRSVV
jgi:hypothetical protein